MSRRGASLDSSLALLQAHAEQSLHAAAAIHLPGQWRQFLNHQSNLHPDSLNCHTTAFDSKHNRVPEAAVMIHGDCSSRPTTALDLNPAQTPATCLSMFAASAVQSATAGGPIH